MTQIFATGKSGTIGKFLPSDIKSLKLDLQENQDFLNDFPLHANLVHLAGIVGDHKVVSNPKKSRAVNIDGCLKLATEFKKNKEGRFIYVSSSHVYGESRDLLSEISVTTPINLYGEHKLEAELGLYDVFADEPERLVVVRVFSVLDWSSTGHSLGTTVMKIAREDQESCIRNCDDVRDFLTPKAVANGLNEIANNPAVYGLFNLCSGVGLTVGEAAKFMLSQVRVEIHPKKLIAGNSNVPRIVGNNYKLKKALPEIDLAWKPSAIEEML